MTLESAAFGVPMRVSRFEGLDEAEAARLSGLGLRPGAGVTKVMPTPLQDPVSCLVGGTQLLAIERRLLAKVRVEAP